MPSHLGKITVKGKQAEELNMKVGTRVSVAATGIIESISMDIDFDQPLKEGSKKEPKKILHVRVDLTDVNKISSSEVKNLKEVFNK